MTHSPDTPLLDTVKVPSDLRNLAASQLRQLADELRAETISAVSVTGGHLGAGLGVVELTTAIHYVFNTPDDRLVWDVGHQCYPHKILTGRRDRIRTLRTGGGLSGFTKRSESEYDPFGAAHSSTSISAALGFAVANKIAGKPGKAIAVIGDGSMSAGMAYEAMNNAQAAGNRLVVILNDNDMSIAPPVGGLSAYLSRLVSSSEYLGLRSLASKVAKKLSRRIYSAASKAEEFARGMAMGGTLFEELGFYYVGPIDGHNLDQLIPVLENVRDNAEGPVLIHVVTQKGKGYAPAENAADKYHGVAKFDVISGTQAKTKSNAPAYTTVFGQSFSLPLGLSPVGIAGLNARRGEVQAAQAAEEAGIPYQVQAEPRPTGTDARAMQMAKAGICANRSPNGPPRKMLDTLRNGQGDWAVQEWPDGKHYLTGLATSQGYKDYPGLGWTVIARQSLDEAYAPARELTYHILLWGSGLALLSRYKGSNLGKHSLAVDHGQGGTWVPVESLDALARLVHRRALGDVGVDHDGGQPVQALDLAVDAPVQDLERRGCLDRARLDRIERLSLPQAQFRPGHAGAGAPCGRDGPGRPERN